MSIGDLRFLYDGQKLDIKRLEADNARLSAEVEQYKERLGDAGKRHLLLSEENERLSAELARIRQMPRVQTLMEHDAFKAEIERLRRALEWYADTHHIYLLEDNEVWRQSLRTHAFVSHILLKEVETGKRAREALDPPQSETP